MDWEAEGLLEGLTDDAARDARRALLDKLHDDGVPVEELRQAVAEQRLALLPVERLLGSEARYTARDIADQSGLDLDWFQAQRRALGLAVPDPDERVYGETDLESAKLGRQYREVGLPEEDAMEAQRVLGRGMARYAESVRDLVGQTFLQAGTDEARAGEPARARHPDPDAARRAVARVRLQHAHARGVAAGGRDRRAARHRADGRPRHRGRVRRPRRLHRAGGDDPVGGARQRRRAAVAAGRGGDRAPGPDRQGDRRRGDARLAGAGLRWCESTLRLVEASDGAEGLPAIRAGVAYGPAVNRWGDWYGSTVNVASRLTERARPASVLATENVRDAADGFLWSYAGEKKLKGLSAPLRTYRARRAD